MEKNFSMARQPRLDAPNVVHHVLARGVARGPIFRDDEERQALVKDLGALIPESGATCLAWCLMTTHIHLVLRTGRRPLRWLMQRLLLRHAQRVNDRWHRVGHVFQNRYKSLLVDQDSYLLSLVRYVHRNPLDAGITSSPARLAEYPWCGHGALMGTKVVPWQATTEVLGLFHHNRERARIRYLAFIKQVPEPGSRATPERRNLPAPFLVYDESTGAKEASTVRHCGGRILGGGLFVARTLRELSAQDRRRQQLRVRLRPVDALRRAAEVIGIPEARLHSRDRRRPVSEARAVASSWLVDELGMRVVDVAELLKVSSPSICVAVIRGRRLIETRKLSLVE